VKTRVNRISTVGCAVRTDVTAWVEAN